MIRDFVCLFQDWNLRGERSQSGSGQPARDVSEEPRFVAAVNGLRQTVFLDRGWTSPWLDQGKLSKDFSEANAMVVKCGKNQLIIVDHSRSLCEETDPNRRKDCALICRGNCLWWADFACSNCWALFKFMILTPEMQLGPAQLDFASGYWEGHWDSKAMEEGRGA